MVQSPTHCSSHLRRSVDNLVNELLEKAASITDEDFATLKNGLITTYSEGDKNMREEFRRNTSEI